MTRCREVAKRMEYVQLAGKPGALQTLREVRLRLCGLCRLCRAALYRRFPIGRLGNVPIAGQVGKSRRLGALRYSRLEIDWKSALH